MYLYIYFVLQIAWKAMRRYKNTTTLSYSSAVSPLNSPPWKILRGLTPTASTHTYYLPYKAPFTVFLYYYCDLLQRRRPSPRCRGCAWMDGMGWGYHSVIISACRLVVFTLRPLPPPPSFSLLIFSSLLHHLLYEQIILPGFPVHP